MIDGIQEVFGRIQPAPSRRPPPADSAPSMDEALARVRRIAALDEDTRRAASYVRRPAVTS